MARGLEAGLSPHRAIEVSGVLRRAEVERLSGALQSGASWTEALEDEADFLEPNEIEILSFADRTGRLPQLMSSLAAERRKRAKAALRATLAVLYPLGILHFAALALPLHFIVEGQPEQYLGRVAIILVPLWVAIAFLAVACRASSSFAYGLSQGVPLVAAYSKLQQASSFTRVLALGAEAGLPIDETWAAAARATRRRKLRRLAEAAQAHIGAGASPLPALQASAALPPVVAQQYAAGEDTGSLDRNLAFAADEIERMASGRLTAATIAYPTLLFFIVAGFVVYQIFQFWMQYFDTISSFG